MGVVSPLLSPVVAMILFPFTLYPERRYHVFLLETDSVAITVISRYLQEWNIEPGVFPAQVRDAVVTRTLPKEH